jgi:hypothetical protein
LNFGTGSFTVSAWVNLSSSTPADFGIIGDKEIYDLPHVGWEAGVEMRGGGYGQGPALRESNGSTGVYVYASGDTRSFFQGGNWVYVAYVINLGNNVTFYINGISYGTDSISTVTGSISNSQPLDIGGHYYDSYPGFINDVRIYNRPLSATEIQAMYNAEK